MFVPEKCLLRSARPGSFTSNTCQLVRVTSGCSDTGAHDHTPPPITTSASLACVSNVAAVTGSTLGFFMFHQNCEVSQRWRTLASLSTSDRPDVGARKSVAFQRRHKHAGHAECLLIRGARQPSAMASSEVGERPSLPTVNRHPSAVVRVEFVVSLVIHVGVWWTGSPSIRCV